MTPLSIVFSNFIVHSPYIDIGLFLSLAIGLFKSGNLCFPDMGKSSNYFNSFFFFNLFYIPRSFVNQLALLDWVLSNFFSFFSFLLFISLSFYSALWAFSIIYNLMFSPLYWVPAILHIICKSSFSYLNVFMYVYPVFILWMQYFLYVGIDIVFEVFSLHIASIN